ncbi:MAG: T9SS C-terminal target domain-containing protein, partial [Calditrichaeota bacterium]
YDDLFLVNAGRNELYKNSNGALKKISTGEIALDNEPSIAASWGDYNNDGFPDCYVCNEGVQNSLYKNNGDGTFKKITSGNIVEDQGAFRACAWADVNRDGHLDLYLTNRDGANLLYVNDGTAHFKKDYSDIIGLSSDLSYGCGWCDFDNDGDMDIYICNDGANRLYEQVSPMKFSAVSPSRMPTSDEFSIGCSWGDYNNDGYMDLFVTNAESANKLYTNQGNGSFAVLNNGAISADIALSKGSGWADYDNDGDLDLIVSANGAGFLYRNRGDGTFEKLNNQDLVFFGGNSLSMAWGDVNNDGNLDFIVSSSDRKSLLYQNFGNQNLGNKNKWLKVRCEGTISNKLAIGAKIRVKATIDGKKIWQTREINSQSGHRAQGSFVQHFGLGQTAVVDSLVVIWPTQKRQIYTGIAANQTFDIAEDNASAVKMNNAETPSKFGLQQNYPNPFNSSTTIAFDVPTAADVTLQLFDARGQRVKTLVRGRRDAGRHTVLWDGRDDQGDLCSSGVYVCRLALEQAEHVCKMTLLK